MSGQSHAEGVQKRTSLLNIVHVGDSGIGLGVLRETDKAETTAATGVAVLDDNLRWSVMVAWERTKSTYGLLDLTKLLELGAKGLIASVPREASVVAS